MNAEYLPHVVIGLIGGMTTMFVFGLLESIFKRYENQLFYGVLAGGVLLALSLLAFVSMLIRYMVFEQYF